MQVSTRALGAGVGDLGAAAGQIVTYLESGVNGPAAGPDTPPTGGYYADSSETAGAWVGRGFGGVHVEGEVDRDGFTRVLLGRDPTTGAQLVTAVGSAGRTHRQPPAAATVGDECTVAEAAQLLGVRESYVRRLLSRWQQAVARPDGVLPATYLAGNKAHDGSWRVAKAEIERFATTRRKPSVVVGYDVTFSVPKSVSVLWAVLDEAQRAEIVAAVDAAVTAGVTYMEDNAAFVRVKGRRLRSDGIVAASYLHGTSRALEPQLHRHVVIANMGAAPGGRVQALDGAQLHLHQGAAAALAGAELRRQLSVRLGVSWTEVVRGKAEIEGIPRAALQEMSTRSAQINDLVAELGNDSAAGRQVAAYRTRAAKVPVAAAELRDTWRARLAAAGLDRVVATRAVTRVAGPAPLTAADIAALHRSLGAAVTEDAACFDRRDVLRHVADWAGDRLSAEDVCAVADGWLASDDVVAVGDPTSRARRPRDGIRRGDGRVVSAVAGAPLCTTTRMLELELRVRQTIEDGFGRGQATVPAEIIDASLREHPTLGVDQRQFIRALTTAGHRHQLAVGPAGTGKTFALRVAARAWTSAGYRVVGAAVGGTAAEVLGRTTGVPTTTVAGLLTRLDTAHPQDPVLDQATIVVVDEASTLGNRDLDRLVAHVERAGASLRLVGDPAQHGAVPAGGLWRSLVQRYPTETPRLTHLRRQRGPDMDGVRRALEDFRVGKINEALQRLDVDHRIIESTDVDDVLDRLVADWYTDRLRRQRDADIPASSMIAERHIERHELNRRARELLTRDGTLHGPELVVANIGFRAGDEVIARVQDRTLRPVGGDRASFIRNGTRGTVLAVHTPAGDQPSLVVDFDGRGPVAVPWRYLDREVRPGVHGGLAHSYALTSHAAQGETYGAARHLATERSGRAGVYVGLSRGTHDARLYITPSAALVDGAGHEHGLPTPQPSDDVLDDLLAHLRVDGTERTPVELDPSLPDVARLANETPLLELLRRARREPLAARAAEVVAARVVARAVLAPPPELRDRIGARPAVPGERLRWDRAVGAVALHRHAVAEASLTPAARGDQSDLLEDLARRASSALDAVDAVEPISVASPNLVLEP